MENHLKNLTKEENIIKVEIDRTTNLLRQVYQCKHTNSDALCYQRKNEEKEFGYYISYSFGLLYILMMRLKIYSLFDIGSGPGLGLKAIDWYHDKKSQPCRITLKGCDNELSFYAQGNNLSLNIVLKDMTILTKEDIKNYKILYFYEPLIDRTLCNAFAENLSKIVNKKQIIVYYSAGAMGQDLNKHLKNTHILYHWYYLSIYVHKEYNKKSPVPKVSAKA